MVNKRTAMGWVCIISLLFSSVPFVPSNEAKAEVVTKTITIDGRNVNPYHRFKGFGTVTANNTTRLLLDYKEEHPEKYWDIMNQLFNKDTGAGLTHVKVELGADVDSSSGTEPATMRYADEPANVLRGAGFQFAADAKSINPQITTEILRWGEPRWTWNGAANKDYENRYQWYKQTIDAVYEEYGFKLDYIGISQNERAIHNNGRNEVEWLKYFTKRIKEEPNYEADYKDIKLVAADGYRDTETISRTLLNHPDLIDEIDVISSHYGLTGSDELNQLQHKLISEGKEPKEVWVSEGIAPMINARYRLNMEPHYGGLGGRAGIVDVTSRIISVYSWTGAGNRPLRAVSFDFQPSVSAFYEGSSYHPKHLINASDPWSGFYEIDGGILGVRHVMNFVGYDDPTTPENERWMYVEGATYSDGEFFDGGVDVDTSTHHYMTLKDPETDDYTTVFANNTKQTRQYKIQAKNLSGKENAPVYVWETRGPDEGQAYDANWFKNIDVVTPNDGEYAIEVKPYSIVTISTLDKKSEIEGFEYDSQPVDLSDDTIMPLPYTDDFEYDHYPVDEQGRDYVDRRGGTPRYTTDQRGAFEVVKEATKPVSKGSAKRTKREIPDADAHGNMLQQKITPDIIGAEWAVWGGEDGEKSNSNPHTIFGDFRWVNYKVSYDFLLDTYTPEERGRPNYALIGVRQVKTGSPDSSATYNARIYSDGKYEMLKLGNVVKKGMIEGFDQEVWHNLALEAKENVFTLYLDGEAIASYTDKDATVMAGRAVLGSGYYETLFDNLKVEPIEGYAYASHKYDNAQGKIYDSEEEAFTDLDANHPIGYVGKWDYSQTGYAHFNRTLMTAETDLPVWNGVTVRHSDSTTKRGTLHKVFYSGNWSSNDVNAWGSNGASFEITFKGTEIRLYGVTNPANGKADVYLDGELVGEANYFNNSEMIQMVWSAENLEDEEHTLQVVAKDKYTSFNRAEITTTDSANNTNEGTNFALDERDVGNHSTSAMIFQFEGSGFNLFGATRDALIDVYIDDQLVDENYRIYSKGDRQTTYHIRGLEHTKHIAKIDIKGGTFVFDGLDVITGTTEDGAEDIAHMLALIERFTEEGDIVNDDVARTLTIHLTAVGHYEKNRMTEKAKKHMKSFKRLLDYQRDHALMSERAHDTLQACADSLIQKWP